MIGQECIDELADYVGLKEKVSAITERAMRGEIAFEPALRERVALLKDLPVGVIDEIIGTRITLTPGGRELVGTMRANGAYAALVSGGFTLFTGPIGAAIGFDEHRSNRLAVEEGRLKGEVEEPIFGREGSLRRFANCASGSASNLIRPWRSATAPTTSRCSAKPAWAWRSMPSPRSRLRPTHASSMRT